MNIHTYLSSYFCKLFHILLYNKNNSNRFTKGANYASKEEST